MSKSAAWGKGAWGASPVVSNSVQGGSPVALASIMSEQQKETALSCAANPLATSEGSSHTNADADLAKAIALSLQQAGLPCEEGKSPEGDVEDTDYALALQLQEEEQASYESRQQTYAGSPRGSHVTLQSQYMMKFQELALNGSDEKRLLSADDAPDVINDEPVRSNNPRRPIWASRDKSLKGQGGDKEIITKHDPVICGRRNVENLAKNLSSRYNTGDFKRGRDLQMSNEVVNSLRRKLKSQQGTVKGLSKTVEKDGKQTHSKGLDQRTRLILQAFLNSGLLDAVHGTVRTGKEAIVYHAEGTNHGLEKMLHPEGEPQMALEKREYAVKVFKTTLTEFKSRMDYVSGDHRFAAYQNLSHQNPRKIVSVWCEKELKNLTRINRVGIPSPQPIKISDHVLLMTFLGKDGWASPQLKETNLSARRYLYCYVEIALILRAMYHECQLIHADFSEYNILYHHHRCHVIDVGQAVTKEHPQAENFLLRDCRNVLSFFQKKGVDKLIEAEELQSLIVSKQDEAFCNGSAEHDPEGMVSKAVKHAEKLDAWSEKHRFIVERLFR